jgi:hypothetical protein
MWIKKQNYKCNDNSGLFRLVAEVALVKSIFLAYYMLIGSLAMVEMKILLASIYIKYKTVPSEGCTVESMAFDDQITSAVPYAQKCMLEFKLR